MKPLLLACSSGLALATSACAIPLLQLDINNGTYVGGSEESTITTQNQFLLQALLTPQSPQKLPNLAQTYSLSVALTPRTGPDPNQNLGFFLLNGVQYDVTGSMTHGAPPLDEMLESLAIPDLANHGIFDTFYYEFAFTFGNTAITPSDPTTIGTYNVEDGTTGSGNSYLREFAFDVSGLSPEIELHFDLYSYALNQNGKKVLLEFAPFSHDAGTAPGIGNPGGAGTPRVPDGGTTVGLLGLALLGMIGARRHTIRSQRPA